MVKQTMLRPLARRWLRGPAWVEGDVIAMDRRRTEVYDPLAEPKIGMELTRVRTPADAVSFVGKFGLLRFGAEGLDDVVPLPLAREPVQSFIEAAGTLRDITRTMLDVRLAADGDTEALSRIRTRFVLTGEVPSRRRVVTARDWHPPDERIEATDDRTLLMHASQSTAWRLSVGLKETRTFVFDRADRGERDMAPGRLRVGILPRTLLDVCYMTIATALADRDPVAVCPECERVFVVEDARQRFCMPTCASRARFKKYQKKLEQETRRPSTKKGATRGKTTRTR